MRESLLEPDHPDIARTKSSLAGVLVDLGDYEEARQLAAAARATFAEAFGEDHWRTAAAESTEGAALTGLGDYPAAEERLLASYAVLNADPAVRQLYVRRVLERLAALYDAWGKEAEARRYAALLSGS
jgi:hypothetical protein